MPLENLAKFSTNLAILETSNKFIGLHKEVNSGVTIRGVVCIKAKAIHYIPLEMAAIFFLANPNLKQVLATCMSWLISFAWAYSICEEREPIITK